MLIQQLILGDCRAGKHVNLPILAMKTENTWLDLFICKDRDGLWHTSHFKQWSYLWKSELFSLFIYKNAVFAFCHVFHSLCKMLHFSVHGLFLISTVMIHQPNRSLSESPNLLKPDSQWETDEVLCASWALSGPCSLFHFLIRLSISSPKGNTKGLYFIYLLGYASTLQQ